MQHKEFINFLIMEKKFDVVIKDIVLILVFSSAVGLVFNQFYSRGILILEDNNKIGLANDDELLNPLQIDSSDSKNNPGDNVSITENSSVINNSNVKLPKGINLKQAYLLFKSDKAVFIDARDQWDFGDGHIEGSINIPYYKFDKNDKSLQKIDKEKTIVTYCDGDDCEMSINLAKDLLELGFKNVFVFFDGWDTWKNSGFPTNKSENL